MIRVRRGENALDFARRVAEAEGHQLSDEDLEFIIWEQTGWPAFWPLRKGETPMGCFARQIRTALRKTR